MKKIISLVLILCFFLLTACSNNQTNIAEKVALPIKGHFSVKGDIIVETDKISVTDNVIPNAEAFTYKDGEFYKLKRYEAEIIVPKKYTVYGEYYGNDVNLKIQYFINNSTVYAYSNIDRKEMGNFIDIISIPQNDDSVIIQGSEILPIYVNLKNVGILDEEQNKHIIEETRRLVSDKLKLNENQVVVGWQRESS